mgnify:CR=1 FL=1
MTADERALILDAKDSKDVPVKLRNKLYAALNRFLTSPRVTKSVAEAWKNAADKGHHSKFEFLQTWARDTSGGQVELEEVHRRESTDKDELMYSWITKYDLYINKNAYRFPQIMVYCDKLIAAARSKKHVDRKFRNDPEMKMYKILNSCLENHTESSSRTSDMRIKADVDKGAHETVIQQFAVKAKIEKEVAKETEGLARYETPKKIALLEHDFSVERGELTPTLKVKRRVIDRDYKPLIDALYAEPHAGE